VVEFRRLAASEEELGYRLLVDSVAWQPTKGIRLWDRPLPREVYAARQMRGENFGLFEAGGAARTGSAEASQTLVAAVSLLASVPEIWHAYVPDPAGPWLASLAVAIHGRRLGHLAVEEARSFLTANGKRILYLDCARGFLEGFYREHGFRTIAEGALRNETTNDLSAVLMVCELAAS